MIHLEFEEDHLMVDHNYIYTLVTDSGSQGTFESKHKRVRDTSWKKK